MKKLLLLICCLVATLSIVSAFSSFKNATVYADKDVMTVTSTVSYCTVTGQCPNGGNSVTCTAETSTACDACYNYVMGWLAGGGCDNNGNQQ